MPKRRGVSSGLNSLRNTFQPTRRSSPITLRASLSGSISSHDPRRDFVDKFGYGPNWRAAKKKALKLSGNRCQKCGMRGIGYGHRRNIFVHHIRKIKYFINLKEQTLDYVAANALSNLIVLCNRCHKYADAHDSGILGISRIK
jgi:5-methylcytosine-specific restriction endonuclease McrA